MVSDSPSGPWRDAPTWPNGFLQGRHGSFFEWHNQWYFAYCDISQTGNRYFRDTFISYIHYKPNGEMALIRVDGVGVGEYDADNGKIEAEDYFKASRQMKVENKNDGFGVGPLTNNDFLTFNYFDSYDPETGEWEILTKAPHIRDHFPAIVVEDKLYCIGGRNSSVHHPDNRTAFFFATIPYVNVYDFTEKNGTP